MNVKLGDALLQLFVLGWLSVSVGPWYVGVIAFLLAWIINSVQGEVLKS